jgi:glycerol kinase
MKFILAIDQGTTGTTAVLINSKTLQFHEKVNQEFPQHYPSPGLVEHDLNEIWSSCQSVIAKVLKKANASSSDIISIGITNQRETTCAFNKKGDPLAKAIVWQDRRTHDYCKKLIEEGHQEEIRNKTGLPIDPYFSGTKMHWYLNNNSDIQKAASENNLLFGTIDTFLVYKLTNCQSYTTEPSNASRTMLMDLKTCQWDSNLIGLLGIKEGQLPIIKDSFTHFGSTKGLDFLPDGIPITGILGDQQSALFGQAGYKKGEMKCTYGTGAFMLLNTGKDCVYSENGLLTTIAFKSGENICYALEGSSFIAGAAVQWLRDNLKMVPNSPAIEELALQVTDLNEMKNILFLPFFAGIGSPYWKADAQGAILGITRDTDQTHISRACLEGICLSINDLITSMRADSKLDITSLKVDGGAAANELLLNIQASISKLEIVRPKVIETTAYGAALASAIGNGQFQMENINELWKKDRSFVPNNDLLEYFNMKKEQWTSAIKKLFL